MGDLEEAEAEKGCRGERYTIDEINLALSSLRLQQVDEFLEILQMAPPGESQKIHHLL